MSNKTDSPKCFAVENLRKVVLLCDNMFYNNYLATGVLNTREEIQSRIKNEITQSFIDFFGEEYSNKIRKKIGNTKINFVYQTVGPINALEEFLKLVKTVYFNQKQGYVFENPDNFVTASNKLSNQKNIADLFNGEQVVFNKVLRDLGIPKERVVNNPKLINKVVKKIHHFAQLWNSTGYSDIDNINKNLKFLQNFVDQVNDYILDECDAQHKDPYEAIYEDFYGIYLDPLTAVNTTNLYNQEMLREDIAIAQYDRSEHSVNFGICPSDCTLVHEFIHALDGCGFEKFNTAWGKTEYSKDFRMYSILNEVVTDYFSFSILEQRKSAGKEQIISLVDEESAYVQLFSSIEKVLVVMFDDLKASRLKTFPAEWFMKKIGKGRFQNLALLLNELLALLEDKQVVQEVESSNIPMEAVYEKGMCLHGSVDKLTDIVMMEDHIRTKIDSVVDNIIEQRDKRGNFVLRLIDDLRWRAGELMDSKNNNSQRLAGVMIKLSNRLDLMWQKTINRKLSKSVVDSSKGLKKAVMKDTNGKEV